ncbi:hypothetical protein LCGC14_0611260 [marine sediment metagenome]|uniref:Uncharacterized protein n=1 Tax=marine sediment metagenome TaxID=412755 RepID=A0A0F9RCA8_9ZZZZ
MAELYKPISISESGGDKNFKRVVDDNFINLARHLNDIRQWIDIQKLDIDLDDIDDGSSHVKMTTAEDSKLGGIESLADVTGDHEAATIASQGSLATMSAITSGIDVAALQGRLVYDNTLAANATSVTLSGLSGDTDKEYFIVAKWVRNGALNGGGGNFGVQCNGDTGVSNYGWETIYNATGGGNNATGWNDHTWFMLWMGRADTDGYLSMGYGHLLAESGYERMLIGQMLRQIDPTGHTTHSLYSMGCTWWNSVDEITNLQFLGEDATSMKIGTHLLLYKRTA